MRPHTKPVTPIAPMTKTLSADPSDASISMEANRNALAAKSAQESQPKTSFRANDDSSRHRFIPRLFLSSSE